MKNIIASLALGVFLVFGAKVWAGQTEAQHVYEGESYFGTATGTTANTNTGNSSYVNFQTYDRAGVLFTYYLWVDSDGKLRIASYPTISAYSSFPSGDWRLPNFNVGTKVGSQS